MCPEIHVNDFGTSFRPTIKDQDDVIVNVSGALSKQILFKKPNGTLVTKDATYVLNGEDGQIEYIAESGFIDTPGAWQLQGYVRLNTGQWYSTTHEFRVFKNLSE